MSMPDSGGTRVVNPLANLSNVDGIPQDFQPGAHLLAGIDTDWVVNSAGSSASV